MLDILQQFFLHRFSISVLYMHFIIIIFITIIPMIRIIIIMCSKQHILWRFFHRPISIERSQLLLNTSQWVSELTVVQGRDCLLNPLQQVSGHRLVVMDHAVILTTLVDHLQPSTPYVNTSRIRSAQLTLNQDHTAWYCSCIPIHQVSAPFRCLPPVRLAEIHRERERERASDQLLYNLCSAR